MTGYGSGIAKSPKVSVTVEMKSVNHRFCDISVRLPKQLFIYEEKIKKIIQSYVSRGKLDVYVTVEGEEIVSRSLTVDWSLLKQYGEAFNEAERILSIKENLSLNHLLQVKEIFQVTEREDKSDVIASLLINATEYAAKDLYAMRVREGEIAYKDFINRLHKIGKVLEDVSSFADDAIPFYREKLLEKVKGFLSGSMEVEESRILTEVAIYADKSDINEEIERLKGHISQFIFILESNEPIGRKLDFLIQEMNREVNTIGSKSNDLKISANVVELKSEIEKLKEQVQNIE